MTLEERTNALFTTVLVSPGSQIGPADLLGEPLQVPIKKAAEMLGFSRQTLYKMREDGQIFFACMRGRAMVPMSEVRRVHATLYPATQDTVGEPVGEPRKPRVKKIKLHPVLSVN